MTDFATWLRERVQDGAGAAGDVVADAAEVYDLANLAAQQHEALEELAWPLKQEPGCSGPITLPKTREEMFEMARNALKDAEAFKEKYSHDTD